MDKGSQPQNKNRYKLRSLQGKKPGKYSNMKTNNCDKNLAKNCNMTTTNVTKTKKPRSRSQ